MTLRDLPSVDFLLHRPEIETRLGEYGRELVLFAARSVLDRVRTEIRDTPSVPPIEEIVNRILLFLEEATVTSLRKVINATGVILHTNLGRAPLSRAALDSMIRVGKGYCTLEYDLKEGERSGRAPQVERLLRLLTGAEAALVVNNNAAAVLLALAALAKGKEVLISRSQLVEIGGGFRIPDVLRQSGAKLVEVGTTNRTHRGDYEEAITPRTAMILRAHPSNFRIVGFTAEPGITELAEIGTRSGIPVVDDIGSGALLDTARFGLGHEPMVQESLVSGATLVLFSGDKLLGGPQAGILVGRTELVAKARKHPLARAVRADKLCLAALEATLIHYLRGEAEREIPVWRMIAAPVEELDRRARLWAQRIGQGEVVDSRSTVGGGSLPEETLPTRALALAMSKPQALLARLRAGSPPVIARVAEGRVLLDPRTVLEDEDEPFIATVTASLAA
ncbi:MAG: L-seryl-tRNA(Sec) selenium transferase [Anaerolineales bacterium]